MLLLQHAHRKELLRDGGGFGDGGGGRSRMPSTVEHNPNAANAEHNPNAALIIYVLYKHQNIYRVKVY